MTPTRQTWVAVAAAAALIGAAYVIIAPFLISIGWAAILAYATWPVYRRLLARLGGRSALAASVMTILVVLAIALPIAGLSVALADDVARAYRILRAWSEAPPDLPRWVAELPLIGPALVERHAMVHANPGTLPRLVAEGATGWSQALLATAGDVGRNLARLGMTLLTVFFLYRHGEEILAQTQRVVTRLAGDVVQRRLQLVGATVRGVCYGVLLTAGAQGLLAGFGFWVMGIRGAVLLGVLTALLALVPFGPPLVWLPVGVWALFALAPWKGITLLVWGAVVVSGVDNVLRPYLIGGATQAPFLLVFFGVLGGLASFGVIGLFIGPTVLAVLLAVWRDWAAVPATPKLRQDKTN